MTGSHDPRAGSIVKIRRHGTRSAAGVGVLVGDRQLVTCAHVVNTALGRPQRDQDDKAGQVVQLDFPLLPGTGVREAEVRVWVAPPGSGVIGGDVAGLEVVAEGPPAGARPATLAAPTVPTEVTVFGYPTEPARPDGGWSTARLVGSVGSGLLQLDRAAEAALAAQPGYSGSPVFDERDARVVGLLAVAPRLERRDSAPGPTAGDTYAIPVARLVEAWPQVCRVVPPSPYRGLGAFTQSDADVFFGRETEADDLAARVRENGLTCLVGPSGIGKTSLLHAGLLPRLADEGGWTVVPFRPGRRPVTALAAALVRAEDGHGSEQPSADRVRRRAGELAARGAVELAGDLADLSGGRVLVLADQFEECLTTARRVEGDWSADEAAALVRMLLAEPQPGCRVRILVALRSDFLGDLQLHPAVTADLRSRVVSVQAMPAEAARRALVEPAARAGVSFAPGLVDRLLRDAGSGPGRLPLLEFAVTRLWESQWAWTIRHEEYVALGEVSGALGAYAEQIAQRVLTAGVAEPVLRRTLTDLVRAGYGEVPATRRIARRGHDRADWQVMHELAAGRLVVLDRDDDGAQTAELTHEALLDKWDRLARLVEDEADFVRWRTRLDELAKDHDYLLPQRRVDEASRWLADRPDDIPGGISDLVARSADAHARSIAERRSLVDRADALRLAAAAEFGLARGSTPLVVLLTLVAESLRRAPTLEGDLAARHVLRAAPRQAERLPHHGPVNALAFSPDSRYVATGSDDGSARVFDTENGTETARLDHDGPVNAVAFSPDGQHVATGSDDRSARLFDTATGSETARFHHHGTVRAVVFSPDSRRVATGSADGSARVFDTENGTETARLDHDGPVNTVAFSPNGQHVATGSDDGSARVFDTATGSETARLDHDHWVNAVAFSPDGRHVATGSDDHSARVFDTTNGTETARLDHDDWVNAVAFSPDGRHVATGSDDRSARVFDTTNGTETARLDHDDWVNAVAFSPDGRHVATASGDGSARVFDPTRGNGAAHVDHDDWVNAVAFSPDGRQVATGSADGSARVFDAATGAETARLYHDDWVNAVAFSPDGRHLATASADRSARVFDAATGTEIARLDHDATVRAVAFSPDGQRLATGSDDRSARVFDVGTGAEIAHLNHDGPVNAVAFSPDGRHVVTGSIDRSARVFDAATGTEIAHVDHDGPVNAVAFSPDGSHVATGGDDRSARVFQTTSGTETARLDHDDWVNAVAFSPDGRHVATGSADRSTRTWPLDVVSLVDDVLARASRMLARHGGDTAAGLNFQPPTRD